MQKLCATGSQTYHSVGVSFATRFISFLLSAVLDIFIAVQIYGFHTCTHVEKLSQK